MRLYAWPLVTRRCFAPQRPVISLLSPHATHLSARCGVIRQPRVVGSRDGHEMPFSLGDGYHDEFRRRARTGWQASNFSRRGGSMFEIFPHSPSLNAHCSMQCSMLGVYLRIGVRV